MNIFKKVAESLTKTKDNLAKSVENVLKNFTKIDEELFEELEDALIMADVGVETSTYIIEKVKDIVKTKKLTNAEDVRELIQSEISTLLKEDNKEINFEKPTVILIVGVNGVGKTTTIGKLSYYFKSNGKKVMLAAADTFRAAAIDQLEIWSERTKVDIIKHKENSDPSAVVFDAVNAAKARNVDILIVDTAGRLHNKKNLMEELRKIKKVISRGYEDSNIEVFLVLDANTGQNALLQAKAFSEVTDVTGLVITKLDSTAKGGIIIAVKHQMGIPIHFVGLGENIEDLIPFDSDSFSKALFE
ncbi:MAG: signal recognition particle-docking protein FtsY [Defluviitaleaceae bacterium]|nr:signal recognition particle-docking protein FtsY [Defluviitaleaceae bacterium]